MSHELHNTKIGLHMHKLYCYVDESGQDTTAQPERRRVFIVAVAIFAQDQTLLESVCEEYEQTSGKGKAKWNQASPKRRLNYLQRVIHDDRFCQTLCYAHFYPPPKPQFDADTIASIALAIEWKNPPRDYSSDIFIDGISERKQTQYANALRALGIRVRRVHQARDESYALIRLADALAGLTREAIEGQSEASMALLRLAIHRGIVSEISIKNRPLTRGGGVA